MEEAICLAACRTSNEAALSNRLLEFRFAEKKHGFWGELPRLVDAVTALRLSFPWSYTSYFYAIPGAIEHVIEEVLSNSFPPSPLGIYKQSRAITSCDTSTRLDGIKCPTLVAVGNEDILSRVFFSEQLVQGTRDAELVVLEKCGHGLPTESPEVTAVGLLAFLSRGI